jgi:hypothetical protein
MCYHGWCATTAVNQSPKVPTGSYWCLQSILSLLNYDPVPSAVFGWCSWLSRQSNTLKVPSSILGSNIFFFGPLGCTLLHPTRYQQAGLRLSSYLKVVQWNGIAPRQISHNNLLVLFLSIGSCREFKSRVSCREFNSRHRTLLHVFPWHDISKTESFWNPGLTLCTSEESLFQVVHFKKNAPGQISQSDFSEVFR